MHLRKVSSRRQNLTLFRQNLTLPGGATVVAGCTMKGGDVDGQLPESARFSLECRLLPGAKRKDFLDELAAFLENYAMGASIDVHYKDVWFDGFAPGNSISANHFLAVAAHDALKEVGYTDLEFSGSPLFCEGALLSGIGIPTLPAMGPGCFISAHKPNEFVSTEAILRAEHVLASLINQSLSSKNKLLKGA